MSWLTPLGFLGLIGLIILLIIYIIKPNYQNKIISSTFVWKLSLKYKKNKIPISKLRNLLLLLCQIFAIIVSSLILAQPFIESDEVVSNNRVFIIDASASMTTEFAGETRFERAINMIKDQVEDVYGQENGQVTIILAGEKATFLVDRADVTARREVDYELNKLLDPAEESPCTYADSDIAGAIKLSERVTAVESNVEVMLFTDNSYIDAGQVKIMSVRHEQEWNAAILDVRANMVENRYEIEVDVACYGINRDVELTCTIVGTDIMGGAVNKELTFTARCDNDQTETVVLSFQHDDKEIAATLTDLMSYTSIFVTVAEEDNLEIDNSFSLYGGEKQSLKIQYCSSKSNNYFDTVLKVLRDRLSYRWDIELKNVVLMEDESKQQDVPATEGYDLYIYEEKMPALLPTDGVILLVNPNESPAGANFTIDTRFPMQSNNQEWFLTAEEPSHPLLNNISAEKISVSKYYVVTSSDGYDTLLSYNNDPLLLVKNESDEKIMILPFSLNFSNLPIILEFPQLIYNIIEYFIPSTVTEYVFDVNSEIELNSRSEEMYVTGAGEEITVNEFPYNLVLKEPGTYTVIQTPISGIEVIENFFVKMPSSESNINAEIDALENPLFHQTVENNSHQELLLYFAIALVVLLFAEWWLHTKEQF